MAGIFLHEDNHHAWSSLIRALDNDDTISDVSSSVSDDNSSVNSDDDISTCVGSDIDRVIVIKYNTRFEPEINLDLGPPQPWPLSCAYHETFSFPY